MPTPLDQAMVIICVLSFWALIVYLLALRPVMAIGFIFILFTFVWRSAATAYIDLAGPVFASQLERQIGPGGMSTIHVLAYLLTIIPFMIFLNERSIAGWKRASTFETARSWFTIADLVVLVSAIFLGLLILEMLSRGITPLLQRMERFEYNTMYAGALHLLLIRFGNLLCCLWGIVFAAVKLRENRFDYRFIMLLGVLLIYMFAAGNRFSAFYSFGSFFMFPYAAVIAVQAKNLRPFAWLAAVTDRKQRLVLSGVACLIGLMVVAGLYNNLVRVRSSDHESPGARLFERVLIQPSEIGWVSYERIFLRGEWQPERTFDALFLAPLVPGRNTTPQYLMLQTIGEPRTTEHISGGFQFAGGFPEIFFELFGPYYGWLFILAAAVATAFVTTLMLKSIVAGHYMTAFLAVYVLYGFLVMYIGGMLNFLIQWTYAMKIAALIIAGLTERTLSRYGIESPWLLVKKPSFQQIRDLMDHLQSGLRSRLRGSS